MTRYSFIHYFICVLYGYLFCIIYFRNLTTMCRGDNQLISRVQCVCLCKGWTPDARVGGCPWAPCCGPLVLRQTVSHLVNSCIFVSLLSLISYGNYLGCIYICLPHRYNIHYNHSAALNHGCSSGAIVIMSS